MTNLLPQQNKAAVTWQGRIRIMSTFVGMSLVALGFAAAVLLPVGIYSKVVLTGVSSGAGVTTQPATTVSFGAQRQALVRELRGDKELLEQASRIVDLPHAKDVLRRSVELIESVGGIELRMVSLDSYIEKGIYTARLSGIAESRSLVVAVKEVFEQSGDLLVSDFPLDNLTPQGGEYSFTIEVSTQVTQKNNE